MKEAGGTRRAYPDSHQLLGLHRFAVGAQRLFALPRRSAEARCGTREVRPKLGQKRKRFHPFRSSNASLHAKALVIDQKIVFIGSMNMDARSAHTNSELGLVMRSPRLPGR
jgi:phosphatidylserine/phosphatidylglycerophosphate/cardiolipin synthase-like enzyme